MISPEDRFRILSESVWGNEKIGRIIDWDQRRWYAVCGLQSIIPPEEEKEIGILQHYIDQLAPDVHTITLNDKGILESTNAEEDPTMIPYYPRYSDTPSLQGCFTVKLSELTELDRLGPSVDLMAYTGKTDSRKVVFKYIVVSQRMRTIWNEMHFVKDFRHPNLVSIDRVVIDDVESRVLGFTTPFVPGGTLDQVRDRIFRFEWLKQLTAVVDYLNFQLGIMHQDIAPRNLVIDPATDKIKLFDFDRAVPTSRAIPSRNDVKGVIFTLYEIITEDGHFREVPFEEQDPQQVQSLEHWPVKCKLDSDVSRFRKHLNDWVQERAKAGHDPAQVEAPKTPDMPPASPVLEGYSETGEPLYNTYPTRMRAHLLKLKKNFILWERPPQQQSNVNS